MSTLKDFRFQVNAAPLPWRRVRLTSTAKPPLEAATPPEFRGGTPGMWTPEDLLVAAVASCYIQTLRSIAAHREVLLRELEVEGVGHVTRHAEGRLGFVVIELRVQLTVDEEDEHECEQAARDALRACLVGRALEVPVELELTLRTVERPVLAAAAQEGALR
jgi:organic hydroperoxide reductase OsmC/OhrA